MSPPNGYPVRRAAHAIDCNMPTTQAERCWLERMQQESDLSARVHDDVNLVKDTDFSV